MKSGQITNLVWILLMAGVCQAFGVSYPDTWKTAHFIIHYDREKVPSNKDTFYKPAYACDLTNMVDGDPDREYDALVFGKTKWAVPFYIRDIGEHLEQSLEAFVNLGITRYSKSPDSPNFNNETDNIRHVYVTDLTYKGRQADGETNPITGSVYISQRIPVTHDQLDVTESLRKACAHELLHSITADHYSGIITKISSVADALSCVWWWECLATQADRLVWPGRTPFEAEMYAMDPNHGLQLSLHKSWDDCNSDPAWYNSGAFLTWLLHYRSGAKARFEKVFLSPVSGVWNIMSYTRSSLDEYVRNELGSPGLGFEYRDFLMYLLEKRNPDLYLTHRVSSVPYMQAITHSKNNMEQKKSVSLNIPYMSMRLVKIVRYGDLSEPMYTIKHIGNAGQYSVQLYECGDSGRRLLRELKPYSEKDSMNVYYEPGKWTEVAVISHALHENSSAVIEIVRYPQFDGIYKGKIEFSGVNPRLDSRYSITLSDLEVIVNRDKVTARFEFHKEYPRDGFYAKGVRMEGTIDVQGNVELTGPVEAFTYPKGSIGCCDFPRVKDDPKCIRFNHSPYFWKFNGKAEVSGQKTIMKGFIAAGVAPGRFLKGSDKLYAFTAEK